MKPSILATIIALALTASAHAEVTLSAIFADHAVVQRDRSLSIWGTADPNEKIRVTLGGRHAEAVADENGSWLVVLRPQPASSTPLVLQATGQSHSVERSDILIGDVWHASGQSNMAMNIGAVAKSLDEVQKMISTYDHPEIRFVRINDGPSSVPLEQLRSEPTWTVCTPESVKSFSAAAFFFARKIHDEVGVPIGIINTSRGGTPIEPFIPRSAFSGHPTLERERDLGDKDDLAGIWRLPGGVRARDANWLPGRLFHSRIAPISKYAVRGCLWYQGESNCGVGEDPRDYQHKMKALISGWREHFDRSDLPFYFVQLPGSGARDNWPYLREQQRLAATMDNVGLVVTIDLEHPNIHPPNKLDVGERLARWALAKEYQRTIPFSGPLFSAADIKGDRVSVTFEHAASGLMVAAKSGLQPPVETPDASLNHFELADSSGVWHPAHAVFHDNRVVVRSEQVERPTAVRYAYAISPKNCNLFNRDGLPASPFCSKPELLECNPGIPE